MSLMGHFPDISIHALREESDYDFGLVFDVLPISIHALREESDVYRRTLCAGVCNFYPRSP